MADVRKNWAPDKAKPLAIEDCTCMWWPIAGGGQQMRLNITCPFHTIPPEVFERIQRQRQEALLRAAESAKGGE